MKHPALSPAASVALTRLIASNPFRWKKQLQKFWAKGIARDDFETELYRLRNTHGHSWLRRFKAPNANARRAALTLRDVVEQALELMQLGSPGEAADPSVLAWFKDARRSSIRGHRA